MKNTEGANRWLQKVGLDLTVGLGLIGVLIFFVISGLVAYFNTQTLQEDNGKIVHSHEVIAALDTLLSEAQDAEPRQRGFLLTGNDKYLDPYSAALAAIPSKLNTIAHLTSDNPTQQANIVILKSHIDAKLAELKETIE